MSAKSEGGNQAEMESGGAARKEGVADVSTMSNKEWRTYARRREDRFGKDIQSPISGYEMWGWPEFQALAKRLGLDLDQLSKELTIQITETEVTLIHTSLAVDKEKSDAGQ